jgi:hypothetical protein
MSKVFIYHNGQYSGDTIRIIVPGGDLKEYEWGKLNYRCLAEVLEKLGHEVEIVSTWFEHDEDMLNG